MLKSKWFFSKVSFITRFSNSLKLYLSIGLLSSLIYLYGDCFAHTLGTWLVSYWKHNYSVLSRTLEIRELGQVPSNCLWCSFCDNVCSCIAFAGSSCEQIGLGLILQSHSITTVPRVPGPEDPAQGTRNIILTSKTSISCFFLEDI